MTVPCNLDFGNQPIEKPGSRQDIVVGSEHDLSYEHISRMGYVAKA